MQESTWVRSVYLYLVCAAALLAITFGAVTGVAAVSRMISPSLGHRDSLDRVGIGLSNVASELIERYGDASDSDNEEFCRDVTVSEDEFQECVDDIGSGDMPIDEIVGGLTDVRSEFEDQIRHNATAQLIRSVLITIAGVLVWRAHARRAVLYAPVRQAPAAHPPAAPPSAPAPASTPASATLVAPPVMPPSADQPLNEFD